MKLGFIGTGKITSSVISGICSSKINYKKIFISSRNSLIARGLKKKFKKIFIEKDNQKIVDNCDWIFLAVTPIVGQKIIKDLRFRSSQTIISFISTINLSELPSKITQPLNFISYSDKIKKLNYKKYNSAIKNFLKKHDTKIIFEPGRSIIGNTGTLVSKIIYIKDGGAKNLLF